MSISITPAMKEVLNQYLKENLEIQIIANREYDYYGGHSDSVTVQILLNGEVISSSSDSF